MTGSFYAGRIGYFDPDGENGREWFEMVPHAAGRTVRAFCEMDELGLTRDVSLALDTESRPIDAFVRVIQHGRTLGSTWFGIEDDSVVCEGITADRGRVSLRQAISPPLRYLGLHPLVCDGLIACTRGTDRPGEFVPVDIITNSVSPNGEEDLTPIPSVIDVAYIGAERVKVPAGEFDAHRYALRWQPDWSAADLWVHGPDALFLRLYWDTIDSHYDLLELRTSR